MSKKDQGSAVLMSFPDYSTRIGHEIRAFLNGKVSYNNETKHILLAANRWEKKQDIENYEYLVIIGLADEMNDSEREALIKLNKSQSDIEVATWDYVVENIVRVMNDISRIHNQ